MTLRIDPTRPQVWCVTPSAAGGWQPVIALAELVARLWETAPTFLHPARDYSVARKLVSVVPRVRGKRPPLLIIAAHPGDLLSLGRARVLLGRFSHVGAWIIDSFWDERIPLFARLGRTIDRVWITDAELVDHYADVMKVPCRWAPWGSDTLAVHGLPSVERDIDVLGFGRQPTAWGDHATNEKVLGELGLRYQGGFPRVAGSANQQQVRDHLRRAKVVLASSNRASPAPYTHPTREYITARFTDAVACGTIIAGQPPRGRAAELLPKAGVLEIDVSSREAGLPPLKAAVDGWTAATADSIHAHALAHIDWRYRIRHVSDDLGVTTSSLTGELSLLDDAVAGSRPPSPSKEIHA